MNLFGEDSMSIWQFLRVCCTGYCQMCLGIYIYILLNVVSEEILDVKGYSA